ncbi:MAG: FecR family protein, partial [Alkalispirochaeta sp.]
MAITTRIGRTPSALALAALIVSWSAAPALAQDATVVYLEGEPELRTTQGAIDWLDFGMSLRAGESVVTGGNDFVEMEYGDASTIEVQPDTVFTVREVERGGERRTVMSNSAGAVKYRFNRLTGRSEPDIGTSSVVAGVRGTEVAVYAGGEGSSLFVVESGEVEVTSAGSSVSLTQDEAVEVPAGGPPGEKYSVIGR